MNANTVIDDSVSMTDGAAGSTGPSPAMQRQREESQKKSHQELAHNMTEYITIVRRQRNPQPGDHDRGAALAALINAHPQREIPVNIDVDTASMEQLQLKEDEVAPYRAKGVRRPMAEKELSAVRAQIALEMQKHISPLAAREQALVDEIYAPNGIHGAAETAKYLETTLRTEKQKLWWLTGLEDPAIVAKTRIVYQEIAGETGDWSIESLMEKPTFNWSPHNPSLIIKGEPRLLQFASQLVQTGKQGFYLMRKAQAEKLKSRGRVIAVDDDKQFLDLHHLVHTDGRKGNMAIGLLPLFLTAPGQDDTELGELKDEYFRLLKKKEKAIAASSIRD